MKIIISTGIYTVSVSFELVVAITDIGVPIHKKYIYIYLIITVQ